MDLLEYNSSGSSDGDDGDSDKVKNDAKETTTKLIEAKAKRADRRFLQAAPRISALTAGRGLVSSPSGSTVSGAMTLYDPNQRQQSSGGSGSGSGSGDIVLMNNPKKSVLYQPVQGPAQLDPSHTMSNHANNTGKNKSVEANVAVDESTFHEQRKNFQRTGYAQAPDASGSVVQRTALGYDNKRLKLFQQQQQQRLKNKRPRLDGDSGSKKEPLVYGSDDELEHGIWAPPSREERWTREQEVTDVQKYGVDQLAPEQRAEREYIAERNRQKGIAEDEERNQAEGMSTFERLMERKMAHVLPPRFDGDNDGPLTPPVSVFYGKQEFDYKGKSWIETPPGLGSIGNLANNDSGVEQTIGPDHHKCYVPKKCVHRFNTNNVKIDPQHLPKNYKDNKGIQRIRLFPVTGHLLLCAGLNGVCYLYSLEEKQCMRIYIGHKAAIRDVQFNFNGTRFLSASFDRYIRLWNTENGDVLKTFDTNRKVPYVVKFYPYDDNYFVVGCSDNKILTYDCTTGDITQEYNHHLAPVNAILFTSPDNGGDNEEGVDNAPSGPIRMITSSDDKKILIWEWDIGVPIKYISDPTMHSMPVMTMHPSKQFFVGSSLDNNIVVFHGGTSGNRFSCHKRKKFSGHTVAGYACDVACSVDGQYLVSGDGNGKLFFWDWKRTRILQKYHAHDNGPTIGCAWHPLEASTVFTCGWDGIIKMWQ